MTIYILLPEYFRRLPVSHKFMRVFLLDLVEFLL